MRPIFLLTLFFASLTFAQLSAQDQKQGRDVIFLKDGSTKEGLILSYEKGSFLRLQKEDGSTVEIKESEIAKIVQGVTGNVKGMNSYGDKANYKLHTKGWYNTLSVCFGFGRGDTNGGSIAAGLHNVLGYQISPEFGAGIGFGVDNYTRRGETVYPIYTEMRVFLPGGKKKHSYYLSAAGGYGFAFKRDKINLLRAEGGWMGYPAIGFRTATREGAELAVDIGVKFQKALFERQLDNGDIETRDAVFRRTSIRVAISLWK